MNQWTINLIECDQTLILAPTPHMEWEEFRGFCQRLNTQVAQFSALEFIEGADRHCWQFRYQDALFSLHFEYYSQSLWVEGHEKHASNLLGEIYQLLPDKV